MASPNETDPRDFLMGGGGYTSATFKQPGDSVTGFIVRMDTQQQTDPVTKEIKTWKDGTPRLQVRIVLQTEERDPQDEDDSGLRAIYVRGQMRDAVAEAVRSVGAQEPLKGGKLRVTYVGLGAAPAGALNAPKQYEALYRAPVGQAAGSFEEPAPANANGSADQPFDPQPVARARDMRSSTLVAADGGQQTVHDPSPF